MIFSSETRKVVKRLGIQNNHRINNVCELWNNRFRHLVLGKHPYIRTLINKIQNEMSKLALQLNVGYQNVQIENCSKENKNFMRTVKFKSNSS